MFDGEDGWIIIPAESEVSAMKPISITDDKYFSISAKSKGKNNVKNLYDNPLTSAKYTRNTLFYTQQTLINALTK